MPKRSLVIEDSCDDGASGEGVENSKGVEATPPRSVIRQTQRSLHRQGSEASVAQSAQSSGTPRRRMGRLAAKSAGKKKHKAGHTGGGGGSARAHARRVGEGEQEECPICNLMHHKQKNTPYCSDHKATTDALFRQLKTMKKDQRQAILKLAKTKSPKFKKLVQRFENECPAPGNRLPREKFNFMVFMRQEKISVNTMEDEKRLPMSKNSGWLLRRRSSPST